MKILVFAPHNDDETLGVGGTIAKYAAQGHALYICEVTCDKKNLEEDAMIKSEAKKAHKILGVKETIFLELPVVALKDISTIKINRVIDEIVKKVSPEIVFIPHIGDMHIDHAEVAKAVMVAVRPIENPQLKAIYAYETLSETEWNIPSVQNAFLPDTWCSIDEYIETKIQAMQCYKTQLKEFPHPRSLEAIRALAKFRGSTIGVGAAECFVTIRKKEL